MAYDQGFTLAPRLGSDEGSGEGGAKAASYCTDCGAQAPTADSESTLVSKRGWRLVLETDALGARVGAWRCPTCWSRRRDVRRSSILPR